MVVHVRLRPRWQRFLDDNVLHRRSDDVVLGRIDFDTDRLWYAKTTHFYRLKTETDGLRTHINKDLHDVKYSLTARSAMEQQLNRIEALLYRVQYQLMTKIAIPLNNNRSSDQQLLDDLAERRRVALERHRLEWEQSGRHSAVHHRRRSEDGEDEIDWMALLPFCHPFTCIVSGPTGCGKTSFVLRTWTPWLHPHRIK